MSGTLDNGGKLETPFSMKPSNNVYQLINVILSDGSQLVQLMIDHGGC